jgi:hypothetical protein
MVRFCDFCGVSNCTDCQAKTRIFVVERTGNPKQVLPRGNICRLCDRKFLVHKVLDKFNDEIDQELEGIATLEADLDDKHYQITNLACSRNIKEMMVRGDIAHLKH